LSALWTGIAAWLALALAAYGMAVAHSARLRAMDAERYARDAADIAEASVKALGTVNVPRHLRRVANSGTENTSPWTPPSG